MLHILRLTQWSTAPTTLSSWEDRLSWQRSGDPTGEIVDDYEDETEEINVDICRETKEQDRPEDSQPQQYTYRTNREMPDYNYGYQRTMTPLTNSSLYNIEANRHCQRQSLSTSFGSVSPASSCTSPLLSPNRSLFTSFPSSPTSSSPSYNFPTPPQAMSNNHLPNDENNILMENLLKLLQVSNWKQNILWEDL